VGSLQFAIAVLTDRERNSQLDRFSALAINREERKVSFAQASCAKNAEA